MTGAAREKMNYIRRCMQNFLQIKQGSSIMFRNFLGWLKHPGCSLSLRHRSTPPGNFLENRITSLFRLPEVGLAYIIFAFLLSPGIVTGYEAKLETAFTQDGYTLAIKRYMNEGGTPVILAHGFFQNFMVWDLPAEGHSLGRFLAGEGFDVWMMNFRAHGYGDYESEMPPDYDYCFDDFSIYDAGAVIREVRDATGKIPFWIGHSMGGLAALAWLQGVEYQYVKVDDHWVWKGLFQGWELEDIYGWRVADNPDSTAARTDRLKGLVTISTPARMKWEVEITWWNWFLHLFDFDSYWSYNLVAEALANSFTVNLILSLVDYIPSEEIIRFLTLDIRDIPIIGPPLADFLEWVSGEVGSSVMFAQFWWKENMTEQLVIDELEMAVDAVSGKTVRQFMHSIKKHSLMEYHAKDRRRNAYRYNDHYHHVAVPTLVVTGEYDKVANDGVIRENLFEALGSEDRTLAEIPATGHGDMIVGLESANDLYPLVLQWLRQREN